MSAKVAILGKQNPRVLRQAAADMLKENGFEAELLDMATRDAADFVDQICGYDALITCGEKFNGDTIRKLAKNGLRLLSRCGVGTDEMDHAVATECGVAICNAAGTLSTTVAECALGLMLNVLREFPAADADVRKGDWSRFFDNRYSHQLYGKTVGLIGFGDISKALAEMLVGFHCRILAYDLRFDKETADRLGVIEADIPTIQKESDVISLHVPATPATTGMIDRAFLEGMKPSAVLINTARGKVVNEADLAQALKDRVIAGAGLDVFEKEPLPVESPLIQLDNVMLLPHYASGAYEASELCCRTSAENTLEFLQTGTVKALLNPGYIANVK